MKKSGGRGWLSLMGGYGLAGGVMRRGIWTSGSRRRLPATRRRTRLCRAYCWLDAQLEILRPDIVLLVGLLAIQTFLGRVPSLSAAVGTAVVKDGVRYLPLPHPSGVSRWLNEPENVAGVERAMGTLRGWVEEL